MEAVMSRTEYDENTITDEATEAVEIVGTDPANEAPAEAQSDEDAAHEATLAAFVAAAEQAADQADDEGFLSPEQLSPVVQAYKAVTGGVKWKNQAKGTVTEGMKAALVSGPDGFSKARAWNAIQDAILSAPSKAASESKAAAPVDPTAAHAERIATLELAISLLEQNLPEGVDGDALQAKVDEITAAAAEPAGALYAFETEDQEEGAEAPEATPVIRQAVKLATTKRRTARKAGGGAGVTYSGPRRNIAAHIENAFEGVESGTFLKVAEIRAAKSPEYGDELPSAGAISARLFPSSGKPCTVPGIEPGEDEQGNKGARKL